MNQIHSQEPCIESSSLNARETQKLPSLKQKASQKSTVKQSTVFLSSLHQILEGKEYSDMIHWNAEGTMFVITRPEKFAEIVLSRFFKHNNLLSFIRQLNMYGFKKQGYSKQFIAYAHPYFLRDSKELLTHIERSKTFRKYLKPKKMNRETESNKLTDLVSSNEYLKQQNQIIKSKLHVTMLELESLQKKNQALEDEMNALQKSRAEQMYNNQREPNMNVKIQRQEYYAGPSLNQNDYVQLNPQYQANKAMPMTHQQMRMQGTYNEPYKPGMNPSCNEGEIQAIRFLPNMSFPNRMS